MSVTKMNKRMKKRRKICGKSGEKRYKDVPTLLKLPGESNNANSDSKYESKRRSILKYRKSASCSVNA